MDGIFGSLFNSITEVWKSIGISQRISIIFVGLAALVLTGVMIYMGSTEQYEVLYAGLDLETSSQITDVIRDSGVNYKLENGGATIKVPAGKKNELRLRCSSQGIVAKEKGKGLEIFEEMQLGLTDRQQQVFYQRGIQGELQRQINEIPEIVSSRVMISIPRKRVLSQQTQRPSASVMVVIRKGFILTEEQVNSIRYMVASANNKMTPSDVTVADNYGRLLSKKTFAGADDEDSAMARRTKIENELRQKVEAVLKPIVGAENVVAVVSCDVDFNSVDRVIERYESEGVILNEKIISDDSSRTGAKAGGAAGTSGNVQVAIATAGKNDAKGEKSFSETRKTAERSYAVPKLIEKVTNRGGEIRSLTVAVTIAQLEGNKPRTTEQLASLKKLVGNAVGVANYKIPSNIDPITIVEQPFVSSVVGVVPGPPLPLAIDDFFRPLFKSKTVQIIGGLVFLMLLWFIFHRYFSRTMVSVDDVSRVGAGELASGDEVNELGNGDIVNAFDFDNLELSEAGESVFSSEINPRKIAGIIEGWIAHEP